MTRPLPHSGESGGRCRGLLAEITWPAPPPPAPRTRHRPVPGRPRVQAPRSSVECHGLLGALVGGHGCSVPGARPRCRSGAATTPRTRHGRPDHGVPPVARTANGVAEIRAEHGPGNMPMVRTAWADTLPRSLPWPYIPTPRCCVLCRSSGWTCRSRVWRASPVLRMSYAFRAGARRSRHGLLR